MGVCCSHDNNGGQKPSHSTQIPKKGPVTIFPKNGSKRKNKPTETPKEECFDMERFKQIGISTTNPLKLIEGYEKELILPLEEALNPVEGKIDNLSHYIYVAKKKCLYPSPCNLTRDESAAIYIYTMKWSTRCIYEQLNLAWRCSDRSKLRDWHKYLRLLKSALDKLPNVNTEVWQGAATSPNFSQIFFSKSASLYSSMGSCSLTADNIQTYLERIGYHRTILVGFTSVNAKDISDYTSTKMKETMVWPGMKLGVVSLDSTKSQTTLYAHLLGRDDPSDGSVVSSSGIHFTCPYKVCTNRCPRDHKGDHCHGFETVIHTCRHHCGPSQKCDKCSQDVPDLYRCYKCSGLYCEDCCFI